MDLSPLSTPWLSNNAFEKQHLKVMTVSGPFSPQGSESRRLFLSEQWEKYLADLGEYIDQRQGIAVITGVEGVGKTTLIQALRERLPPSVQPLIISRPSADPLAITLILAESLGISLRQGNLVSLSLLTEAVQNAAQQGKYFLLVADDAHVLPDQNLEEIYILSQMEHQGRQLLPLILVGRHSLLDKLSTEKNQRLHELIRHHLALTGLSSEETIRYIDHYLQQAGSSFQERFTEDCSAPLFSHTGGIPRLINQLCDQVLNRARQQHLERVTPDLIGWEEPALTEEPLSPLAGYKPLTRFGIVGVAILISGLIGYGSYRHYYRTPIYHLMFARNLPRGAEQIGAPAGTLSGQSLALAEQERHKIEELLRQVREAQLKKDINLFIAAYSPAFPDLEDKKEKILKTWQRYKYLDLDFSLEHISRTNAHSIFARVRWNITLEDLQSKEKRTLVKGFTVHFSDTSGKWLIEGLSPEGRTGLAAKGKTLVKIIGNGRPRLHFAGEGTGSPKYWLNERYQG